MPIHRKICRQWGWFPQGEQPPESREGKGAARAEAAFRGRRRCLAVEVALVVVVAEVADVVAEVDILLLLLPK